MSEPSITVTEGNDARVDFSQAVVRITKRPTVAEAVVRYNRITVVAFYGDTIIDPATGGLSVNASNEGDIVNYIHPDELGEVANFVGTIRLHNDLSNLDEVYKQAQMWGQTIIFTSGATNHILSNGLSIPSDSLYCWLTHADAVVPESVMQLALRSNVGVMLNQAKDERLIYGISRMVQFVGRVVPTNAIVNDNLAGVIYLADADFLAANGVSFWLKTIQKTYPFSLFLGGEQAYAKYYDAIITHEVREAVAQFVSDGYTMGDLDLLENTISVALGRFADILQDDVSIAIPSLSSMSEGNRRAGVVDLVEIRYTLFGELRIININI